MNNQSAVGGPTLGGSNAVGGGGGYPGLGTGGGYPSLSAKSSTTGYGTSSAQYGNFY